MSNERFDKFLKKNLESIRPAYNASAWKRFQNKLPVSPLASWLITYGGWVVSSLLLTGWVATFYLYREQNKTLQTIQHQINTLIEDKTLPLKKAPETTAMAPIKVQHRVDTVYIIRKTILEHSNQAQARADEPVKSQRTAVPETIAATQADQSDIGSESVTPQHEITDSGKPARGKPARGNSARGNSARGNSAPSNSARDKSTGNVFVPDRPVGEKSIRPTAGNVPRTGQQIARQSTAANPVASGSPAGNEPATREQPVSGDTLAAAADTRQADSIAVTASTPPEATLHTEKSTEKTQTLPTKPDQINKPASSKPQFSIRQLKPRIGIQGFATPTGFGAGFALDFQVIDKINLTLGLQAQHIHTENHNELDDYNAATGQDFTEIYKNFLPAKYDHISEISISETLLTLPVSINYYIPLRKQWSAFVNAGTQLNLSGFQEVFYEAFSGSRENHRSFEFRTTPPLFTNFVLGGGLQWQKKNIAVQVGPSFKYVFHRDMRSTVKSAPGLNASVFLNLFN